MIDSHIHTSKFSMDSKLTMEEIQETLDSRKVCVCEHMDFGSYVKDDKKFNVKEYFEAYHIFQDNVLLGIEIGMDVDYSEIFEFDKMPFDYILGSIHAYRGNNLYNNPCLYGSDKDKFYKLYFHYVEECLRKFSFIDAFAHFDYVSRYTPYKEPTLSYKRYKDEFDKMFHIMIELNILLEVNTKQINSFDNLFAVLNGYRIAGGKYVTLGSDAHSIQGVFKDFDKVLPLIKKARLEVVYFEKRKMKKGEM